MRTRLIPRTTLEASVLCLGTAEFGSVVEDSVSEAITNKYVNWEATSWIPPRCTPNGFPVEVIAVKNFSGDGSANARAGTVSSSRQKALQSKTGYSVAQIALGYLLGQPFPVFPIIGPKSIADLVESLSASEVTLTADQVDFLTAEP